MPPSPAPRTWSRDGFLSSTDPSLIPISALNEAFASDILYWATPLPEPQMRQMLDNSLSFGLYSPTSSLPPPTSTPDATEPQSPSETLHEIATHVQPHPSPSQPHTTPSASTSASTPHRPPLSSQPSSTGPALIGYARCITDHTTFLYLTDVYVLPAWQGQGLGAWLIACVQEVVESMPHLRRSMAVIGGEDAPGLASGQSRRTEGFYERLMRMGPLTKGKVIQWKGPGNAF